MNTELLMQLAIIIAKILMVLLPVIIAVAYLMTIERKVIGYIQQRPGPNRVGFAGILQPVADGLKFIGKELIFPRMSNIYLFFLAPILSFAPAFVAWSVVPFEVDMVIADIDAGVLFVLAMTSLGAYGVLAAGWASNSKYAFLGAMRAAAQIISYEISMSFALVGVLMAAGSMNLTEIVLKQQGGILSWYWLPLLPLFIVYWISAEAETNRSPFDVAEGESELVAGFHVEYSGMGFALFFIAEYANMILISFLSAILFFGGWLSPFEGLGILYELTAFIPGLFWLLLKSVFFLFLYLWMRATFPRYRYDQIMQLGWKILIPVSLGWLPVVVLMVRLGLLG